jgi:hypothetical protein
VSIDTTIGSVRVEQVAHEVEHLTSTPPLCHGDCHSLRELVIEAFAHLSSNAPEKFAHIRVHRSKKVKHVNTPRPPFVQARRLNQHLLPIDPKETRSISSQGPGIAHRRFLHAKAASLKIRRGNIPALPTRCLQRSTIPKLPTGFVRALPVLSPPRLNNRNVKQSPFIGPLE